MASNEREIEFVKMTGAGNDFVLIDNRSGRLSFDWKSVARSLCERRCSIGADGLLVIETSTKADFLMRYFNADGSDGGMCGNGGRCAASYIMRETGTPRISFEALDHLYFATLEQDQNIKLSMKDPVDVRTEILLPIQDVPLPMHFIDTGAPHAVIFMDELPPPHVREIQTNGIVGLGKDIRSHSEFAPQGTNVDFVELHGNSRLSIRTYERGVERETLACGTGSVACAIMSSLRRSISSPVSVRTLGGETLVVSFRKEGGRFVHVELEGPANNVFSGRIHYEPMKSAGTPTVLA